MMNKRVAVELGGQKLPGESFKDAEAGAAAGRLILADGRYTYQNDQGTYKLGPADKPKTMDITGTAGPQPGENIFGDLRTDG